MSQDKEANTGVFKQNTVWIQCSASWEILDLFIYYVDN